MATIAFPTSPSAGQQFTYGAKTWQWTGSAWKAVVNQSQIVSVFTALLSIVDNPIAMPNTFAMTSGGVGGYGWTLLNYV